MPATIQGHRPDPRIRQTQLAELRRLYGEVVRRQQGGIVFLAREPRFVTMSVVRIRGKQADSSASRILTTGQQTSLTE